MESGESDNRTSCGVADGRRIVTGAHAWRDAVRCADNEWNYLLEHLSTYAQTVRETEKVNCAVEILCAVDIRSLYATL